MILIFPPIDSSASPITPDYGGPTVCFADGVFDPRFPRFITVMEGTKPIFYFLFSLFVYNIFHMEEGCVQT